MNIDMKQIHELADSTQSVDPRTIAGLVVIAVDAQGKALGAAYGAGYTTRPPKDKFKAKCVMGIGREVKSGYVNGLVENLSFKTSAGYVVGGFKAELTWGESKTPQALQPDASDGFGLPLE